MNKKEQSFKIPDMPNTPPSPPENDQKQFKLEKWSTGPEYKVVSMQLGMQLPDAAVFVQKKLDDMAARGFKYVDRFSLNSSEAVLIFERNV
jgi:hypothetical protein